MAVPEEAPDDGAVVCACPAHVRSGHEPDPGVRRGVQWKRSVRPRSSQLHLKHLLTLIQCSHQVKKSASKQFRKLFTPVRNVLSLSLEQCSGRREEAIVKGLLIPDCVSGCIGE